MGVSFPRERMISMKKNNKTLMLTVTSVMTALATVIYMIFPEIPLVPGVEHLKMDFSDIPAILTGFIVEPWWGFTVEVVKNIIHLTRTSTMGIGELINVGIGAAVIFSFAGFMKLFSRLFSKERMSAAVYFISAACVIACAVFAGWLLNGLLTPIYFKIMGIPVTAASVFAGVWGSTLLNTIKAAFNVLPFYPVYIAAVKAFSKITH